MCVCMMSVCVVVLCKHVFDVRGPGRVSVVCRMRACACWLCVSLCVLRFPACASFVVSACVVAVRVRSYVCVYLCVYMYTS